MTRPRTTALLAALATAYLASVARAQPEAPTLAPLALSPDGQVAASAAGRSIRVFDVATGKLLRHFRGHEGDVNAIAFAPDGKTLVSASDDKTARVWDVATGKETLAFKGHNTEVRTLAVAPDGKRVASCGNDQLVQVWDPANGKAEDARNTFSGQAAQQIRFSSDGKTLSWVSGTIICWVPLNMPQFNRSAGSGQWLHYLTYVPGGNTVVAAGPSRRIEVYDGNTGGLQANLNAAGNVTGLAAGGKLLAVSYGDGIQLFEIATRKELRKAPAKDALSVALSADGKVLATRDAAGAITLFDPETGKAGRRLDRYGILPTVKADPADKPEALWEKLAVEDDGDAVEKMARLAAQGDTAVKFAREKFGKVKGDPELNGKLKKYVGDLDDDSFAVRETAADALRGMGDAIEPVLRDALRDAETVEARSRLRKLLLKAKSAPPPTPETLRALRMLAVLEAVDTPAAREVLGDVAKGSMLAPETRAAQAALTRLEKK